MKTILHTVDIDASPEEVFGALTTERGLAGWWTTEVDADVRVGGAIDLTFRGDFNPHMEVTALEPPRTMRWRCGGGHDPWRDNTFRFDVEARGSGSILFFRQEYSRELSDEEYGRYNFNWGFYLESLRLLVETGAGKPYQAGASV